MCDHGCVVCFDENKESSMLSCGHWLCTSCMLKAVVAGAMRCPMCRQRVVELPFQSQYMGFVSIIPGVGDHVGVTLKDVPGGVEVLKVCKQDLASEHFLRPGMCIRSVNGIPAVHHRLVVDVINECTLRHTPIRFEFGSASPSSIEDLRQIAIRTYNARASFHPEWDN